MHRNRPPMNKSIRVNSAGENTAAPSALPKNEINRRAPFKGSPKPIPSTMGYVGKRIK